MSRARLNLYLQPAHAERLTELATMRGLSKSAIVAAAIIWCSGSARYGSSG